MCCLFAAKYRLLGSQMYLDGFVFDGCRGEVSFTQQARPAGDSSLNLLLAVGRMEGRSRSSSIDAIGSGFRIQIVSVLLDSDTRVCRSTEPRSKV